MICKKTLILSVFTKDLLKWFPNLSHWDFKNSHFFPEERVHLIGLRISLSLDSSEYFKGGCQVVKRSNKGQYCWSLRNDSKISPNISKLTPPPPWKEAASDLTCSFPSSDWLNTADRCWSHEWCCNFVAGNVGRDSSGRWRGSLTGLWSQFSFNLSQQLQYLF